MSRELLDAPENLPEEALRQVAFGKLQDEVPGVPNKAPVGLEQPLLETRQGPTLDSDRQDQPAQEIAEVVGDDPEKQADLVGPEPVTGEPGPVGGFLALLDPLLGRPALVVEADDGAVRSGQGGDDEAHPRKELPEMKRLELLKEVVPGLSRVAFLWNPDARGNLLDYKETEAAARALRPGASIR